MRKTILALAILVMLAMTACGSQASAQATQAAPTETAAEKAAETAAAANTTSASGSSVTLDTSFENAVSVASQLLVGILKLKGTDQAVTSEQAAALLALWTNYQTLTSSMNPGSDGNQDPSQSASTPAAPDAQNAQLGENQTQLDEITSQVQSILTAEQVTSIAAMQITSDTITALMEELGIDVQQNAQNVDGGASPQGGGTPPDMSGTPPADGGAGPQGGGTPPEMSGTPSADGGMGPQGGRGGMMTSSQLLQALIDYLTEASTSS